MEKMEAKLKALTHHKSGKSMGMFPKFQVPVFLLMSMPGTGGKPQATIDMPRQWDARETKLEQMETSWTGNPNVTIPPGDITGYNALVVIYKLKAYDVKQRKLGSVSARNTAYRNVLAFIKSVILPTVQLAANANPGAANTIIESCLFKVITYTTPSKPAFAVYSTLISGEIKFVLNVKAMAATLDPGSDILLSAFYMQSLDGINWTPVDSSLGARSKMIIDGFPVGITIHFRVQGTFSKGRKSAWVYAPPFVVR